MENEIEKWEREKRELIELNIKLVDEFILLKGIKNLHHAWRLYLNCDRGREISQLRNDFWNAYVRFRDGNFYKKSIVDV